MNEGASVTARRWTALWVAVAASFLGPLSPQHVAAQTPDDVVLHATNATTIAGQWRRQADTTAASGSRLWHPNAGAPKVDITQVANPANYFELTFQASAGRPYRLWLRMRAENDYWGNDSLRVQFSDSVTSTGAATFRIGTSSATDVNLEACRDLGVSAWGWQDNGWCDTPPADIYFAATGMHTIRVQTREDGVSVDQIVLSPQTTGAYFTAAPGLNKNDATILSPSSGGGGGASNDDEVVLYASDVQPAGAFVVESDPDAAAGVRVRDPNLNAGKVNAAVVSPANYFEATFNADAGKPYRLWMRLRAENDYWGNDSVWVQFSDSVNGNGAQVFRIGTDGGTFVNLEDCSGCGLAAWGWQDNAYGTGVAPALIYFAASGSHTIRVQRREDGVMIDQIILSSARYLNAAPGTNKNDNTIVPKPGGNREPTITSAVADPTSGNAPLTVRFTASATDPEGDTLEYIWNFGDNSSGAGAATSHDYAAGTWKPRLTVRDSAGNSVSRDLSPINVTTTGVVQVTLFQLNIHHGRSPNNGANNLGDVVRLIDESDAQVVSLNEVEFKRTPYHDSAGPEDQPAKLEQMLESSTGRCWAQLKAPRNGNVHTTGGVQVNLLLWQTNEKKTGETCDPSFGFQATDTQVHLLPDDPQGGRSMGAVTLLINGRSVVFMTTHLTWCNGCVPDNGFAARTAQVKELLRLSGLFPSGHQQILAGDFNVHPDQSQYTIITGADTDVPDDGFADAWLEAVTKQPPGYNGDSAINDDGTTKRVDYIFRLRKSTVTKTQLFRVVVNPMRADGKDTVSDHFPLIGVFEVR